MALLIFIAILVVLIWVHELGHFTAAKLFGIKVDEFSIGFPPRLFSVQWGETRYSFNLLLLGGYVSIRGENDSTDVNDKRSMASRARPIQALVIVAGIVMNLLFGWLVLSTGYLVGTPATADSSIYGTLQNPQVEVVEVLPGSPADVAGVKAGDTIDTITSGTASLTPAPGNRGLSTQTFIGAHQNESLIFTITHDKVMKTVLVVPKAGIVEGKKVVGIVMDDVGLLKLPIHLALIQGAISAKDVTVQTAESLSGFFGSVLRGKADLNSVSGPVGIASVGAGAVKDGFAAAAFLTALISINLALMNLLPIPGLDGGRLLIIIIESIIRRPVAPKVVGYLSIAGFALIILLMVAVTYHDIAKLVG